MSLARSRIIALTAISALLLSSFGYVTLTRHADAADLTTISDTLSDSDLGIASNHTIVFTAPSGIANGETFSITFPDEFNISTSSVVATDIDVAVTGTGDLSVAATCAGSEAVSASVTSQALNLTFCSGDGGVVAVGGTTTIEVGTNATFGSTGANQFVNPAEAGSYQLQATTSLDSAYFRVAIIDDVVVTAAVDTVFTFQVFGLPAGIAVNGSGTLTGSSTSPTSLPFGVLSPGTPVTLAQNLRVTTNAVNGFSVTLNQDQDLTSSGGADINSFANGGASSTPAAWEAPAGYLDDDTTYGHMGITSEDESLTSDDFFGSDLWVGNFVGNPVEIFAATSSSDGSTEHIGSTTVGFQAEIMAFQEAGTDYTANLTYVATPVF